MKRIGFDCETHLIRSGMLFPRVVCVTFADRDSSWIRDRVSGVCEVLGYLADLEVVLIGHNTAYDLGVVCAEAISMAHEPATAPLVPNEQEIVRLIFQAYADNRISDTMIRSMLVDIATGKFQEIDGQRRGASFSLKALADRWLHIQLAKDDTWRLHYAALDGAAVDTWPADAREYALLDAEITFKIDAEISAWARSEGMSSGDIPDQERQIRAAWVLHLMSGWGVKIDADRVTQIRADLEAEQKKYHAILDQWGIFKKDKLGGYKYTKKGAIAKDQKRLQELITEGFALQNKSPPLTTRGPSTSADTARESGHVACVAFADVANIDKLLSTYVPTLERGLEGYPITSSPNVLVASGRTSWSNPNWQNPPRVGGIRECVIARPGTVLIAADLDTVELRALAQACIEIVGYSTMGDALRAGMDLHIAVAAEILGISYDQAAESYAAGDQVLSDSRQTAKKANFSLPGGVGAKKFAWMYWVDDQPLCRFENGAYDEQGSIRRAQQIKEAWFRRWPEMRDYLQNAGEICGDQGSNTITQPWSGRVRGGLDYCSCANTYFQGRVADGTKLALWQIAWACYVDVNSILYGSRLTLFLHDEVILECPESIAHECGIEIVRLLTGAVQEVIPSIPITSAPVAMRRWYKGAKPVYVDGRLVPSKPEKVNNKTKWLADI